MDETLVTNGQFADFVGATRHVTEAERSGAGWGYRNNRYTAIAGLSWRTYATSDRVDHPVLLVSWEDAWAYAKWAGKLLPTEAQWERAARAGRDQQQYPWGEVPPDGTQCNFARHPAEIPPTTPARAFPPNSFGLYDMVGNAWQWCDDLYQPDAYLRRPASRGSVASGTHRARRGGAWNVIQPFRLRVANRGALDPKATAPNMGFRCVRTVTESTDNRSIEVEKVLDELRLAMEADGGGVSLDSIEEGVIHVRLLGSCLACPSIGLTLKEGLEKRLRERLHWVREVKHIPRRQHDGDDLRSAFNSLTTRDTL